MINSKRREAPTSPPAYQSHHGDCEITTNTNDLSHKKDRGFRNCKFGSGIVHGLQANAFFGDKDLYYALISIFKNKERFEFGINSYEGEFYSKRSGLFNDAGKGLFEYVINLSDTDSLRKLSLLFSPRLEGMLYDKEEKKKAWKLNEKQGEGVHVQIKSSYNTSTDIEGMIRDIFNQLDLARFYKTWCKEWSVIISSEDHIRYHEKKEKDIAKVIGDIFQLVGVNDDFRGEKKIDRVSEGVKFYRVVTDKWQDLGFESKGLFFYLKNYRDKFFPHTKDPVLRMPKLEVGLSPEKSYNGGKYPKWQEWRQIYNLENDILQNVCLWSGMTLKDLIPDLMFKVIPAQVTLRPWQPKKLKDYYFDRAKAVYPDLFDNQTKRRFVYLLTDKGILDTKELMQGLDLSRRQIFDLISFFEKAGIIKRVVSSRTAVEFINPLLEGHFKKKIRVIDYLVSPTSEKKETAEKRKDIKIPVDLYEKLKDTKEKKGLTWAQFLAQLLE